MDTDTAQLKGDAMLTKTPHSRASNTHEISADLLKTLSRQIKHIIAVLVHHFSFSSGSLCF